MVSEHLLLEKAAKAAGYIPQDFLNSKDYMSGFLDSWRPLEDNHDAFTLAEDLEMIVDFKFGRVILAERLYAGHNDWTYLEEFEEIPDIIVRLAASLYVEEK